MITVQDIKTLKQALDIFSEIVTYKELQQHLSPEPENFNDAIKDINQAREKAIECKKNEMIKLQYKLIRLEEQLQDGKGTLTVEQIIGKFS